MGTIVLSAILLLPAAAEAAGEKEFSKLGDLRAFAAAAAEIPAPAPRTHDGNVYFSRDCVLLKLGGGKDSVESSTAALYSQKFVEECRPLPPNDLGLIIEHCYSRPLAEWERTVMIAAPPREIPAGGKEVFEVCLEGDKLGFRAVSAFYAYEVSREGQAPVIFRLTPKPAPGPAARDTR